jgi:hypothetical protein
MLTPGEESGKRRGEIQSGAFGRWVVVWVGKKEVGRLKKNDCVIRLA